MKKLTLEEATALALEGKLVELSNQRIDLEKEDKIFDDALNTFLDSTNSKVDNSDTIRKHGWYYQDIVYSDGRSGVFCCHPLDGIYDASVDDQFMDKNNKGFDLSVLINKVNNFLLKGKIKFLTTKDVVAIIDEINKSINDDFKIKCNIMNVIGGRQIELYNKDDCIAHVEFKVRNPNLIDNSIGIGNFNKKTSFLNDITKKYSNGEWTNNANFKYYIINKDDIPNLVYDWFSAIKNNLKEESVTIVSENISKNSKLDPQKIVNFVNDSIEFLLENNEGCCEYELDNDLSIFCGWSDGYDKNDESGIKPSNEEESTWRINVGVKCNHDYLKTDFDWLNFAYDKDTGDVVDAALTVEPNGISVEDAKWLIDEYRGIREAFDKGDLLLETKKVESLTKKSSIQGLEHYSEDEIKQMAEDYIKEAMLYADYTQEELDDFKIIDMNIYGSRNRGTAKDDSDLDIVFEYTGDFREDDLFNLLNDEEEPLMFEDIVVDFNPICAEKSGDMNSFMARSKQYDDEILNKKKTENKFNKRLGIEVRCKKSYIEDNEEYWSKGNVYNARETADGWKIQTNQGSWGRVGSNYMLDDFNEYFEIVEKKTESIKSDEDLIKELQDEIARIDDKIESIKHLQLSYRGERENYIYELQDDIEDLEKEKQDCLDEVNNLKNFNKKTEAVEVFNLYMKKDNGDVIKVRNDENSKNSFNYVKNFKIYGSYINTFKDEIIKMLTKEGYKEITVDEYSKLEQQYKNEQEDKMISKHFKTLDRLYVENVLNDLLRSRGVDTDLYSFDVYVDSSDYAEYGYTEYEVGFYESDSATSGKQIESIIKGAKEDTEWLAKSLEKLYTAIESGEYDKYKSVKTEGVQSDRQANSIKWLKDSGYEEYKTGDSYIALINKTKYDGQVVGAMFYGKSYKPAWHYRFRDIDELDKYIDEYLKKKAGQEEVKQQWKDKRKLTRDHDIKVGDIFYTSWGYDQTNIDFYEVVAVRGSRIDLRELKQTTVDHDGNYDSVVPATGDNRFKDDEIHTVSARADGTVTSLSSFEYPSKWDGRPKNQTDAYSGH